MIVISSGAQAQSLSDDEAEVWSFIEGAWAEHSPGSTWHEVMHEDGFGRGSAHYPMGRDRATLVRYSGALGGEGEILFMEMRPVEIVIAGDTATAFYYASVVENDYAGERKTNVQQCADTLVRNGGDWQFLGWDVGP